MKYKFIFCFLKADGSVETNDNGDEMYYDEEFEADRVTEALRKFKRYFKHFDSKPEIMKIEREN